MSIEAMKLALRALEGIHPGNMTPMAEEAWNKAITALRQAIKQAEQVQPVADASAWFALVMCAAAELEDASNCLRDADARGVAIRGAKYYRDAANALYTAPPPRQPWVGLTDEEVKHQWEVWRANSPRYMGFAKGIEAKLKEKNK